MQALLPDGQQLWCRTQACSQHSVREVNATEDSHEQMSLRSWHGGVQVQGMDEFEGLQMHAHNYRSNARFKGQRVIVVGSSFSGEGQCWGHYLAPPGRAQQRCI